MNAQPVINDFRADIEKYLNLLTVDVKGYSDLNLDHLRLPQAEAGAVVQMSYKQVSDSLRCLDGLLRGGEPPVTTPFILLRAIVEASAVILWALEPESSNDRLFRFATIQRNNLHEAAKATSAILGTQLVKTDLQSFDNATRSAGVQVPKGTRFSYGQVVEDVDRESGTNKSLKLIWQGCSAVSHGKTWGIQLLVPTVASESLGDGTSSTTFEPSWERIKYIYSAVMDAFMRSHILLSKRASLKESLADQINSLSR